jgi:hypothetical protein
MTFADSETIPPFADGETFLRLTWWSQDLNPDGALNPAAIRLDDLKSPNVGVSVDRSSLARYEIMAGRASVQQPKSPEKQIKPHVSSVKCALVQAEQDETGPAFHVRPDPIPDNPAHTLICSTRERKESERRALRSKLITLFERAIALDDYFANARHSPIQ